MTTLRFVPLHSFGGTECFSNIIGALTFNTNTCRIPEISQIIKKIMLYKLLLFIHNAINTVIGLRRFFYLGKNKFFPSFLSTCYLVGDSIAYIGSLCPQIY